MKTPLQWQHELAESKDRESALRNRLQSALNANALCTAEIDRLKGELAKEQAAHRKASSDAHHWEEVATNLREENTSIKGELAEARAELDNALNFIQRVSDGDAGCGAAEDYIAKHTLSAAPSPAESTGVRDACSRCHGARGGTPGNENIIDGKPVCDYCHADQLAAATPDDIRARLERVETALHALYRFSDATMKTAEGFERRLIILEDTARKRWIDVAEQIETSPSARHEFVPGPHPELCYFERSAGIICALTRQNPVHAPAAPQEQAGRCQRMVDDRQCTARVGHDGGCHVMAVEVPMWVAPKTPHRFLPQRRHRGIPINLCDECAHEEPHPIHTGAKP